MEYLINKAILKADDKECSSCGRDIKPNEFVSCFGECIDCVNDQNHREYKENI